MGHSDAKTAIQWLPKGYIGAVIAFSCLINLLHLIGPIFMMQVYDRVLPSSSVSTLVGLILIAVLLYAFFGVLDYLRSQMLTANGEAFAQSHAETALMTSLNSTLSAGPDSPDREALEDVAAIRSFLVSPGLTAIFDLIWMPVFLCFIFMLHSILGITSVIAAAALTVLAVINQRINRARVEEDARIQGQTRRLSTQLQRQAEVIRGNGMTQALARRWLQLETQSRLSSTAITAVSSIFTTTTKTLRMTIQSLILALGAFLAIQGELSPGAMIAASFVFSRTLAPIEQLLGHIPTLLRGRSALTRMNNWTAAPDAAEKLKLPDPKDALKVALISLCPPGLDNPVLQNVGFEVKAGDVVGVIGPSGGGKSSLAKALTSIWQPEKGKIMLDGADLKDWPEVQIGRSVGYMAQETELFDGTISENIAGFRPDADAETIIDACQRAGAHKLILSLPDGYNTRVGPGGIQLSAGQRQRVALARTLFGNPFLLILDEPNANLDEQGEAALAAAIHRLKAEKRIVVVIAHRQKILKQATHLLIIENGQMKIFGPKAAVEARMAANKQPAAKRRGKLSA